MIETTLMEVDMYDEMYEKKLMKVETMMNTDETPDPVTHSRGKVNIPPEKQ